MLIFTGYTATAERIYRRLADDPRFAHAGIGLVSGTHAKGTTPRTADRRRVLERFAPVGQNVKTPIDPAERIRILIATDCLSEGQNLQDAATVVHYDIGWNPTGLIQRRGRIDRIKSPNRHIEEVRYWPPSTIDDYLNLRTRVLARETLADGAPKTNAAQGGDDGRIADKLRRAREGTLTLDDLDDRHDVTELTLDRFLADLLGYLREHRGELEALPDGACAAVAADAADGTQARMSGGAVFCLRDVSADERRATPVPPYHVVAVDGRGRVIAADRSEGFSLDLLRAAALPQNKPNDDIEDAIDAETENRTKMGYWSELLDAALQHATELRHAGRTRAGRIGTVRTRKLVPDEAPAEQRNRICAQTRGRRGPAARTRPQELTARRSESWRVQHPGAVPDLQHGPRRAPGQERLRPRREPAAALRGVQPRQGHRDPSRADREGQGPPRAGRLVHLGHNTASRRGQAGRHSRKNCGAAVVRQHAGPGCLKDHAGHRS